MFEGMDMGFDFGGGDGIMGNIFGGGSVGGDMMGGQGMLSSFGGGDAGGAISGPSAAPQSSAPPVSGPSDMGSSLGGAGSNPVSGPAQTSSPGAGVSGGAGVNPAAEMPASGSPISGPAGQQQSGMPQMGVSPPSNPAGGPGGAQPSPGMNDTGQPMGRNPAQMEPPGGAAGQNLTPQQVNGGPYTSGYNNPIANKIVNYTAQYGHNVSSNTMTRMAQIESGFRPDAVSPTGAQGVYQFTKGTWDGMGNKGVDRLDPDANIKAGIQMTERNYSTLEKSLGRAPQPYELYMAHNLGVGGATRLITSPGDAQISKGLIGSNPAYNPKFLMGKGGAPVTVQDALQRYQNAFRGDQ